MPASKKNQKDKDRVPEGVITLYDVADNATRRAKAVEVKKYATKDTLNLCMKDKQSISFELFFLLLALILLFLLFVEFFGIYRPYLRVEQAEAALDGDRATLAQLERKLRDYDDVHDDYLIYNFDDYDNTIVDREKILALLEKTVFDRGTVSSVSISGKTLTINISNVSSENVINIQRDLAKDPIVANVRKGAETFDEQGVRSTSFTVTLADASLGGN